MVGHLARLWSWAIDNAEDGNLSHLPSRAIAAAAGWRKRAEPFVAELRAAGLLDQTGQLHDWDEYAGRLVARRKADRERKRIQRLNDHKAEAASTSECAEHATTPDLSAGLSSVVQLHRTRPDQTVPNPTLSTSSSSFAYANDAAAPSEENPEEDADVERALNVLRRVQWYPLEEERDRSVLVTAKSAGHASLPVDVRRWIERCAKPPRYPRPALEGWLKTGVARGPIDRVGDETRSVQEQEAALRANRRSLPLDVQLAEQDYKRLPSPETWGALKAVRAVADQR